MALDSRLIAASTVPSHGAPQRPMSLSMQLGWSCARRIRKVQRRTGTASWTASRRSSAARRPGSGPNAGVPGSPGERAMLMRG